MYHVRMRKYDCYSLFVMLMTYSGIGTYTWFEAQNLCRTKGGKLTTYQNQNSVGMYWSGRHIRVSNWIKIKGCYHQMVVQNMSVKSYVMDVPSAGRCQELCLLHNHKVFAVQLEDCSCLNDIPRSQPLPPNECNFNCTDAYDFKYSTECGGVLSFNVLITDISMDKEPTEGKCLALQCTPNLNIISMQTCLLYFQPYCGKEGLKSFYTQWTYSMEMCKMSKNPSYLVGDLPINDPGKACLKVNHTILGHAWIGVATQTYLSQDSGKLMTKAEKLRVLQCEFCRDGTCGFQNCFDDQTRQLLCEFQPASTREVLVTETTEYSSTAFTERDETDSNRADNVLILTIVSILIVVCIISGLVVALFWKRFIILSCIKRNGKDKETFEATLHPAAGELQNAYTSLGSTATTHTGFIYENVL